jgi:hypothetical protein
MFNVTIAKDNHSFSGSYLIIDFYFLCILGISGFAFASRYYLGYWQNKSFSKKAMFLKSFPISAQDTIGREKAYLLGSVALGLFFVLAACLGQLMEFHIVEHSMVWIRDYGIWVTLISLGISMLSLFILSTLGINKIHKRDLRL